MNVHQHVKLGAAIRGVQDQVRPVRIPPLTESGIRLLVDQTARTLRARGRRRAMFYSAASALAAVVVAACVLWQWPEKLRFVVGPTFGPGIESHWIHARAKETVPLRFSDGSTVDLLPGTRGRVVRLTPHGANLTVETGHVHARIIPRSGADWLIAAGPFSVRVVGTEFDVAWDPDAEVLRVDVEQGVVRVTGPILPAAQQIVASQRLTVTLGDRRVALMETGPMAEDSPADTAEAKGATEAEPMESPAAEAQEAAAPGGGQVRPPSWQGLYRRADYAGASKIVERAGIEHVAQPLDAEQLLQLADALRLGGRSAGATQMLLRVRTRFPGTPPASVAAYTQGVMAIDQKHAFGEAANWFGTYLREQRGGSLAREALGRQMEAEERAGLREDAEAAARRYLQAFPDGPHRDIARRLTGLR